jgi:demethoxyubiquinone hydroxylase (CLK1/Coq7/Cat5 family)
MSNPVEHLNSFLRGEISAVETYRQALEKVTTISARVQLEQCSQSHQRRIDLLRSRITELGGKPVEGSGPWGALAKLAEGGAGMFGEKAAIDVLEEGEDHGLKDYQSHLSDLDADSRYFVEQEILPAQSQTHAAVSTIKHAMY